MVAPLTGFVPLLSAVQDDLSKRIRSVVAGNVVSSEPSAEILAAAERYSALRDLSRNLASELGPLGVRVNCVAPGLVVPTESSAATRASRQRRTPSSWR